jgi:peptide/nickel transport system permease protein
MLAGTALVLTLAVAVPLGVLSAVRRDSALDHVATILTVLGQATPGFWLGLMLIYLFAVQLRWLPTGGMGSLAHLVMPAVVLAAFYAARVARLTRSAVLDTLNEDYVLTARAKGLAETRVIGKHTLRNSAIPIVTLAGLEAGQLLGGAVVTETIFAWPGLGRLTVQALLNRDFPVVMAAVAFTSVVYTLMNLVVDLAYGWLDPRVRRA